MGDPIYQKGSHEMQHKETAIIILTPIIARRQKRRLPHLLNLSKPLANRKAPALLMRVMGTATAVGTMCRDVASAWTTADGLARWLIMAALTGFIMEWVTKTVYNENKASRHSFRIGLH